MTGIQKIALGTLYLLAGLAVIFAGMYFFGGNATPWENEAGIKREPKQYTDVVLVYAAVLAGLITLLTLGFSAYSIITSSKAQKGFGIAVAAGVVLVGISYAFTGMKGFDWVAIGINLTIILAVLAFVGIIVSEVYRAIK